MKKLTIKRFACLIVTLCLMLTCFSLPVFAQTTQASEYKLETEQDALKLIDAANKGDVKAAQILKSLKAFNKDEVNKVLEGVKFTAPISAIMPAARTSPMPLTEVKVCGNRARKKFKEVFAIE